MLSGCMKCVATLGRTSSLLFFGSRLRLGKLGKKNKQNLRGFGT